MKMLLMIISIALLTIAIIGLSHNGPAWTSYIGAALLFGLLTSILVGISHLPTSKEVAALLIAINAPKNQNEIPMEPADEDFNPRRSTRN